MGFSSSSGGQTFEGGPSHPAPASSSPHYVPPVGQMTNAPSSHFVSSGSFDFGAGLNDGLGELDTAGLMPNLGPHPLEMTEMELESMPGSETLASPRDYGHYPEAAAHGSTGPSGRLSNSPVCYQGASCHGCSTCHQCSWFIL